MPNLNYMSLNMVLPASTIPNNAMHYKNYDEEQLKHLQNVLSMILKDCDEICRENNINYSVDGGTALGTIRHGGIIPWDDDVDIIMFRDDFEKFKEVMKDNPKYELINMDDYPDYFFTHNKLSLKDTKFQLHWNRKTKYDLGINIDVFVLDNVPDSYLKRKLYFIKLKLITLSLYVYANGLNESYSSNLKKYINIAAYKLLPLMGITPEYLKKSYKKLVEKYNNKNCKEVFSAEWKNVHNYPLPRKWFESRKRAKFDDFEVDIIEEYDKYLKVLYNDYMVEPPEENRFVVSPEDLDFGEY